MSKKTVLVLFGGQSSEHEVSRVSAATVISNMDLEKYYVMPVCITQEGKWLLYDGAIENIKGSQWEKHSTPVILSPDPTHKGLIRLVGDKFKTIPVDIIFPVLHGLYGEDGSVQGLFELSGIPYVGCGILASSVSMDKVYTKIIAKQLGILQAEYVVVLDYELEDENFDFGLIENKIGYPCFVKPSNAGSSVGISKATNLEELISGVEQALSHDRKVIIEKAVVGREIECAVLGNDHVKASVVGEVVAAADFYDYDAKYNNAESKTIIPAELPEKIAEAVKELAVKIFKGVDGAGLSRVDFFLEEETNKIIFNEINTLPGFTSISMYPRLFEAIGIPLDELIDTLIELGFNRKR